MSTLSVRELRRKVMAIRRIQQITNAMRLVSTARLQRAQAHLRRIRPYCEELKRMMERALREAELPPELGGRRGEGGGRLAVLVVTSDRGLCGGYNVAVLEKFDQLASGREPDEVLVVAMGRRGMRELRKRPYKVVAEFENPLVTPGYEDVLPVATKLLSLFTSGEAGEVWAVYTKFESTARFYPTVERLLPVERRGEEDVRRAAMPAIYEPQVEEFLRRLVPRAFVAEVFRCVVEAVTSEQVARMIAMAQATDNAQELIDRLTVEMHKARQAAITREVSDIVRAVEVMAGG